MKTPPLTAEAAQAEAMHRLGLLVAGLTAAGVAAGTLTTQPPDEATLAYTVPGDAAQAGRLVLTARPHRVPMHGPYDGDYLVVYRGADGGVVTRTKVRFLPRLPGELTIVGGEIGAELHRAAAVRRWQAGRAGQARDRRAAAETLTAQAPPGVTVTIDDAGRFRLTVGGLTRDRAAALVAHLRAAPAE